MHLTHACVSLVALLTAGAPEAGLALSLNRAVEPPPAAYTSGPTLSGHTREVLFSNPVQVAPFCNLYLGRPRRGYYEACYVPDLDLVVLPDPRTWPSAAEWRKMQVHEWAHARGWHHAWQPAGSVY